MIVINGKGVLLVATGQQYIEEARNCLDSFGRIDEDYEIAVVSDVDLDHSEIDHMIKLEQPEYGFKDKIRGFRKSPFDKTVFLDTDTYVYTDFDELYSLLDRFEFAAAHAEGRISEEVDGVPISFPEFNTGVVVYKDSEKVRNLFEKWEKFYQKKDWPHDQASFRKAVYETQIEYATLTPEYNCRFSFPTFVSGEVKIFHSRFFDSRTWYDPIKWKLDIYKFMDEVNSNYSGKGMRLILPTIRGAKVWKGGIRDKYIYLSNTLEREGVRWTIKRILTKFYS